MTADVLKQQTISLELGVPDYEARAHSNGRSALVFAAVFFVLLALLAILVPIGGAVVAPAQAVPKSEVKRVAHPTGGIIAEIYVRDGDQVTAGASLLKLDTSVAALDARLSENSVEQLIAARARLSAELEDRPSVKFPNDLLNRESASAKAAMRAELRRFSLGRSEQLSIDAQMREQMNQSARLIDGFRAQIAALQEQRRLIGPELEGARELRARGFATLRQLNELERTAVSLDGSIGAFEARIAEARAAIAQTRQQLVQSKQSSRLRAAEELAEIEASLNKQRVASASAEVDFERALVRAPSAGVVDRLSFNSVGDVVRSAETILQIVPMGDRILFAASVPPAEIDRVKVGQPARIRLSSSQTSTSPELRGRIVFVSAEPAKDPETGASFFRVRVEPSPSLGSDLNSVVLGTPAEVFIETGDRSMISYITKPLTDQFARAFRD